MSTRMLAGLQGQFHSMVGKLAERLAGTVQGTDWTPGNYAFLRTWAAKHLPGGAEGELADRAVGAYAEHRRVHRYVPVPPRSPGRKPGLRGGYILLEGNAFQLYLVDQNGLPHWRAVTAFHLNKLGSPDLRVAKQDDLAQLALALFDQRRRHPSIWNNWDGQVAPAELNAFGTAWRNHQRTRIEAAVSLVAGALLPESGERFQSIDCLNAGRWIEGPPLPLLDPKMAEVFLPVWAPRQAFGALKALQAIMGHGERKMIHSFVPKVRQLLDEEMRKTAWRCNIHSLADIRVLQGQGDLDVARRRLQFAEAYPAFAARILSGRSLRSSMHGPRPSDAEPELKRNLESIDTGRPATSWLAADHHTAKAAIRRCRGLTPAMLGRRWYSTLDFIVDGFSDLPIERFPTSRREWQAYMAIYRSFSNSQIKTVARLRDFAPAGQQTWADVVELAAAIDQTGDYLRSIRTRLISPHIRSHNGASGALQILLSRTSGREILNRSSDWHHRLNEINEIVARFALNARTIEEHGWPAIADRFHAANGLQVLPLTTPQALALEGKSQQHCVGDYTYLCRYENSHIVSIRSSQGDRISTAEVRFRGVEDVAGRPSVTGAALEVLQHYGFRNSIPTKAATAALDQWLRAIANGDLPVNQFELEDALVKRRHAIGNSRAAQQAGYDIDNDEARIAVFEVMRSLLVSPYHQMDYPTWSSSCLQAADIAAMAAADPPAGPEDAWEHWE